MDLDQAATQLYALDPAAFTAHRNELEQQARRDGDRDLARQIHGLRKPTVSAWVSNLLVHERPDSIAPLVQLGDQLREAQQSLEGPALRQLSRQRRQLVVALVLQARELALAAGHRVTEDVAREVEQTLDAALADADAARAVLSGQLRTALQHSGFGPPGADGAAPPASQARRSDRDEVGAARRRRDDKAADRDRREALSAARRTAGTTAQEAAADEQAAQAADSAQRAAEERRKGAETRLRELQAELAAETQRLTEAKHDAVDAGREHRRLARTAQTSRRRSDEAAQRLAELEHDQD